MSTVKRPLAATPVLLLCGWFAYDYLVTNLKFIPTTAEERAAIRAEIAAQDENAFINLRRAQGQSSRQTHLTTSTSGIYTFIPLSLPMLISLATGEISMRHIGSPKVSRRPLRPVKSSKLPGPWTLLRSPTMPRALDV